MMISSFWITPSNMQVHRHCSCTIGISSRRPCPLWVQRVWFMQWIRTNRKCSIARIWDLYRYHCHHCLEGHTKSWKSCRFFLPTCLSLSLYLSCGQAVRISAAFNHSFEWLTEFLSFVWLANDDGVDGTTAYHPNRAESSRQVKRFRDLCV